MIAWRGWLNTVKEATLRWHLDDDGDVTLSLLGLVHFTLYKWPDPTVRWGRHDWPTITKEQYRVIQQALRTHTSNARGETP